MKILLMYFYASRFPMIISCLSIIGSIWFRSILFFILAILAILDAKSRIIEYRRVRELTINKKINNRIIKLYQYSKCQRDMLLTSLRNSEYYIKGLELYKELGYRWYHLLPNWIYSKPQYVLTLDFWRTFFK